METEIGFREEQNTSLTFFSGSGNLACPHECAAGLRRVLMFHTLTTLSKTNSDGPGSVKWWRADLGILFFLQIASLSSPLHCYTGGAELCVYETSSWFQEGKNIIFLTFFIYFLFF